LHDARAAVHRRNGAEGVLYHSNFEKLGAGSETDAKRGALLHEHIEPSNVFAQNSSDWVKQIT
jgi:hypothetical protein